MSDEEKEAIEILKLYFGDNTTLYITKYVNIVLNLIEKQSKEIEELKTINRKLEARKYMLNAETGEVYEIPIDNNYISKDKIKVKIEEQDETKQYWTDEVKDILKSLLKKE